MRARSILLSGALGACLSLSPAVTRAGEAKELRFDWARDGVATAGIGLVWIGSEVEKDTFAPDDCRWCDEVPGIDRSARTAFLWNEPGRADKASDVLDFGVLPVAMIGLDAILASQHGAVGDAWGEDTAIIVQTAVTASLINQFVKFSVGRERPFVHALPDAEKGNTEHPHDNNLSFYSGHTSLAFALVGSTGMVAHMRGYRNAWVVWPVGGIAAVTVAWLRIAADKHYLTDVAVGAIVGGTIGVMMPRLLHAPRESRGDGSGNGSNVTATVLSTRRRTPVFTVMIPF